VHHREALEHTLSRTARTGSRLRESCRASACSSASAPTPRLGQIAAQAVRILAAGSEF